MLFRQFIHDDLGCASYLVGDTAAGVAAVVDPGLHVDVYVDAARYLGVRIEHVLETHTHADHVSGHGVLSAVTGATIHVSAGADAEHPHDPVADGWELSLGSVLVRAIATPGHRPEHTSFTLTDRSRDGSAPWAVLTGDALFVGDVGRPDLAVEPADGARALHHSLHGRLLTLPDHVEVWPGHLGGSLCGGPGMSHKVSSTIGAERCGNPSLQETDADAFVAAAISALRPQPPNHHEVAARNKGPLVEEPLPPSQGLSPAQVVRRREAGALLVDVRTDSEFDEGHVPCAVSITASKAGFGTKLGWLAGDRRHVVLIGRDDAEAMHAARLAASAGVTQVCGHLAGGMTTWHQERQPVAHIERVTAEALWLRLDDVQVLDVREQDEWDRGHLAGSVHVPYHDLRAVPDGLDPARPIAVLCASGMRAGVAASVLACHGAQQAIHVVDGGVGTLERLGARVETSATEVPA